MFILQKQGQKPVDVEIENFGDPGLKVEDLKDQREELVTLSGVPAQYLGVERSFELREQLVHTNINFANEIIDMQENIILSLNELLDNVAKLKELEHKPSDYISISLIPPVVLILQLIETTLTSVGNISATFANMNIKSDPYYFLKQYVPHIDWDEFKEQSERHEREKMTKKGLGSSDNQQEGGFM